MIRIDNLTIAYQQPVIEHFSLRLPSRGLFVLTGPSGCGKSTLLKLLSGAFHVSARVSGRVLVNSVDLLRQKIAPGTVTLMAQEAVFFNQLSAQENLDLVCHDQIKKRQLINKFGLSSVINERVYLLSAGERQRLSLVRALLSNSPILLLDEPVAHLNNEWAHVVIDYLREEGEKRLILISSHVLVTGIEVASNKRYHFPGKAGGKVNKKRKTSALLIRRHLKGQLKMLLTLSLFSTLSLIFMLLGIVLSEATKSGINLSISQEHYFQAEIRAKEQPAFSLQLENELVRVVGVTNIIDIKKVQEPLQFYDGNNLIVLSPYLVPPNNFTKVNCPASCLLLPEQESYDDGFLFIAEKEVLSLPIVTAPVDRPLLVESAELLTSLESAYGLPLTITTEKFLLGQDNLAQVREQPLVSNYQFYFNQEYYRIQEKSRLFNAEQFSFPTLLTSDYVVSDGLNCYVLDLNLGSILIRVVDQEQVQITSALAAQLQEKELHLQVLAGQEVKDINLTTDEVVQQDKKILYLPPPALSLFSVPYSEQALLFHAQDELGAIKELVPDYQVTSFLIEIEKFFLDLGNFMQITFTFIAVFFLVLGLLIMILAGSYLFYNQLKDFQTLNLLGMDRYADTLLYLSNFCFLALSSFFNSLGFLFLFTHLSQDSKEGEMVLAVDDIALKLSLFDNLRITPTHYGLLFLLSLVTPTISFLINLLSKRHLMRLKL